ncbi:MAG: metal ABC transporter permease [Acidobacteriota bacterium]
MSFFADLAGHPFLLPGLVAGALAGLACGVVGPYVVARRLAFLAGAVAHVAIGGVGAAIFLRSRVDALAGLDPLLGGALAAVAAAVLLAWVEEHAGERLDTLIGALWSVGMALGILLVKLTPGYHTELMSYLFGALAFVGWDGVLAMLLLDLVLVSVTLLFHRRFLAVCLDPEQAELQGIDVLRTQTVLLVLVALTTIVLTRVVGLILALALLTLPAATAGHLVHRLPAVIAVSVPLAIALATLPRIAVYGSRISPEPAIVLAAAAVYLLVVALRRLLDARRVKRSAA